MSQVDIDLPPGLFVLAFFRGVRVNNIGSETLKVARKRQMLPKIHLVTKRGSVLSLDASVAQQRLENNLKIKTENALNLNTY